jgi:GH35 family endo-1,4-beta-xylanase
MKKDIFYETLGDEYLPFAFDTAKAANPHPLLFLNDNDIESVHSKGLPSKYSGMLRVLKSLIAKGVRVDGLSMQGHFTTGQVPKVRLNSTCAVVIQSTKSACLSHRIWPPSSRASSILVFESSYQNSTL